MAEPPTQISSSYPDIHGPTTQLATSITCLIITLIGIVCRLSSHYFVTLPAPQFPTTFVSSEWERARHLLERRLLHYESGLVALAGLLLVHYTVIDVLWVTVAGLGRHYLDLSEGFKRRFWIYTWRHLVMYPPAYVAVQAAMLVMYLRLFGRGAVFRRWVWALAAAVLVWFAAVWAVTLAACVPLRAFWDVSAREWATAHPGEGPVPGARCVDIYAFQLGSAITRVGLDVAVMLLPVFVARRIATALPTRRRIGMYLAYTTMVGLVIVICLVRAIRLGVMSRRDGAPGHVPDDSFDMAAPSICNTVELHLGMWACCYPATKPLWLALHRRFVRPVAVDELMPFDEFPKSAAYRRRLEIERLGYDPEAPIVRGRLSPFLQLAPPEAVVEPPVHRSHFSIGSSSSDASSHYDRPTTPTDMIRGLSACYHRRSRAFSEPGSPITSARGPMDMPSRRHQSLSVSMTASSTIVATDSQAGRRGEGSYMPPTVEDANEHEHEHVGVAPRAYRG